MLHNHIGGSEDRRVGRTRVFTRLSDVGVQEGTIIKHMWDVGGGVGLDLRPTTTTTSSPNLSKNSKTNI